MPDREYRIRIATVADPTGLRETATGLADLGDAGKKAHERIAEGAGHAELKHRDLHAGVQALHREFPLLAEVAHAALNPIGLAVAGIVGAVAFFQRRIASLQQALSGLELPNITPTQIGHITAMAEAWNKYADAVKKAGQSYNSVDAASDRSTAKIKQRLEEQKNFLAASKGRELADLESNKGSISPDEYEQRKSSIEQRYANAGLQAEQGADWATFAERAKRGAALKSDSASKMREAAGVRVASAADDAITENDLKAGADAAKKRIEEGRKWIDDLDNLPNMGLVDQAAWVSKYHWNFGNANPVEIRRMQQEGIANAQPPIDRYNAFLRQKAAREQLRKTREDLVGVASSEAGEATSLDASLPEDSATVKNKQAGADVQAAIGTAHAIEQGRQVSKESQRGLVEIASAIAQHQVSLQEAVKMMDWAAKNFGNFTQTVFRLASVMSVMIGDQAELSNRVGSLEGQLRGVTRNLPGGQP